MKQPPRESQGKAVSPILHWRETGAGRPVVMIHGAFTTHTDWPDGLTIPLSKDARVIAIDRPGHGRSPRLGANGSSRIQAEQIREGLASALDEPAILLAHSFGAMTALAFAEQYPDDTAGLVLVSPVCFPEWRPEHAYLAPRALPGLGPALSAVASLTTDGVYLRYIHHAMFAPQPIPERWLSRYPVGDVFNTEAFVREGEDAAAISPLSGEAYRNLTRLDLPVQLLQGDCDFIILGGWHARLLSTLLPRAQLIWLRGIGHMLHQVCPAQVLEAVRGVLAQTETGVEESISGKADVGARDHEPEDAKHRGKRGKA
jgi:pimeloyl-ACP methyl ester carboxylesterase